MEKYSKEELREDFDLLIQAWLQSDNENTTHLADSLSTYAFEKLNEGIRESCESDCKHEFRQTDFHGNAICTKCKYVFLSQSDAERT